jgi:hypothetical protein
MSDNRYQLRFDGGHQQRYFADRASLLGCVLRVSKHSPYPRFEVWRQGPPVRLKDGRVAGARYELVEVLDARDGDLRRRVLDELHALDTQPGAAPHSPPTHSQLPAGPPHPAGPPQEGGGATREATP